MADANTSSPPNSTSSSATTPTASTQPTSVQKVAQAVAQATAQKALSPQAMALIAKQKFDTSEVSNPFFRCFLYGDIDSGKTVTAARFGTPEDVRIIVTRQKEQMLPLKKLGYKAFHAPKPELLRLAVLYPEQVWPEWAQIPDRTLVIDDVTQVKDYLNDDNSVNADGNEISDIRRISKGSKDDMRELIQLGALQKPMNLILIALERSWEVGKEIRVSPDLPPSMASMINADFEFVFNMVRESAVKRTIITETSRESFIKKDDKGKEQPYQIVRFARNKIPVEYVGKGIIRPREDADLRAIWNRVKNGAK